MVVVVIAGCALCTVTCTVAMVSTTFCCLFMRVYVFVHGQMYTIIDRFLLKYLVLRYSVAYLGPRKGRPKEANLSHLGFHVLMRQLNPQEYSCRHGVRQVKRVDQGKHLWHITERSVTVSNVAIDRMPLSIQR